MQSKHKGMAIFLGIIVLGGIIAVPSILYFQQKLDIIPPDNRESYQWEKPLLQWHINQFNSSYNYSLFLDSVLTLSNANITDNSLNLSLPTVLEVGTHQIELEINDDSGKTARKKISYSIIQDADSDSDLLYDHEELWVYFSNPNDSDTDGDGVSDGQEVYNYYCNPILNDTDNDNLSDGDEINLYKTSPRPKPTKAAIIICQGSIKDFPYGPEGPVEADQLDITMFPGSAQLAETWPQARVSPLAEVYTYSELRPTTARRQEGKV